MFRRPFEHVPLETLTDLYSQAVKQYDYHMRNNWKYLAQDFKTLVREYGRELRKRKEQS